MWAVLISAVAPFFLLSVTSTKSLTQPLDVERIQKENEKPREPPKLPPRPGPTHPPAEVVPPKTEVVPPETK